MAITITPYTQSLKILCGAGDWLTDDVRLALVDSGYTFNAAHTLFDNGAGDATDPSEHELATGDGYPATGAALATSIANNKLDASPTTFTALDKTFRQGIIYINATVDTVAKPLLFRILFDDTGGGADITIPGVDFSVNWNANGIATLAVA
jgi:hypothetical protein